MRRAPVPSATGEHPCAAECPRTPPCWTLCASHGTPMRNSPGLSGSCSGHGPRASRAPAAASLDARATVPPQWYENELGWADGRTGRRCELLTGLRFDVLELPADAGRAVLRRCGAAGPPVAAAMGHRMRLLVAAGSADELPGLLDWLEWGGARPGSDRASATGGPDAPRRRPAGRHGHADPARRGPPCGCGPPSRGARWSRRSRAHHGRSAQRSGTVGAPPISYGSWTRRRRSATGPGCCVLECQSAARRATQPLAFS